MQKVKYERSRMINLFKSINLFILPNRVNRIKCYATSGFYFCVLAFIFKITEGETSLFMIVAVIYIVNCILLTIKRLHDFNCSGWLSLLLLIPIIGQILGFFITFIPGTKGDNRFGPAPDKARKVEYIMALLWIPICIGINILFANYK